LIAGLDKEVSDIPGVAFSFTQPMAMRMDETVSGVKADLAVKIFGDDFRTLDAIGQQALRAVARVPGAADPQMEITSGVAELSVKVRRDALARYGLNVSDVEEAGRNGTPVPCGCRINTGPTPTRCARFCCARRAANRSRSIRWPTSA
jgi:cobalt-zinc-cadmium resistance protein CzcA